MGLIKKTIGEVQPDAYILLMSVCDWSLKNPSKDKLKKEENREAVLSFQFTLIYTKLF